MLPLSQHVQVPKQVSAYEVQEIIDVGFEDSGVSLGEFLSEHLVGQVVGLKVLTEDSIAREQVVDN